MDGLNQGKPVENSIFNMPELNLNVYVTYICGSNLTRVRARRQEEAGRRHHLPSVQLADPLQEKREHRNPDHRPVTPINNLLSYTCSQILYTLVIVGSLRAQTTWSSEKCFTNPDCSVHLSVFYPIIFTCKGHSRR
jgi:hypothetical protein